MTQPHRDEGRPIDATAVSSQSDPDSAAPRRGSPWSQSENAATVASYLSMLKRELVGEPYSKTDERRRLLAELDGSRKSGAVEFKHQNISAVLRENGWPYIRGYLPATNVQKDLRVEVERQLREDQTLDRLMQQQNAPAVFRFDEHDIANITQVDAPKSASAEAHWNPRGIKRDYLYQHANNRQLGLQGELAVIAMEKKRLTDAGRVDLAGRVDHVAVTIGDGLGYDVHSFETDGSDRLIEVKTTIYAVDTPFFISSSEVEASAHYGHQFYLYRLFLFGSKSCAWYQLRGPVAVTCRLQARAFAAMPIRGETGG